MACCLERSKRLAGFFQFRFVSVLKAYESFHFKAAIHNGVFRDHKRWKRRYKFYTLDHDHCKINLGLDLSIVFSAGRKEATQQHGIQRRRWTENNEPEARITKKNVSIKASSTLLLPLKAPLNHWQYLLWLSSRCELHLIFLPMIKLIALIYFSWTFLSELAFSWVIWLSNLH